MTNEEKAMEIAECCSVMPPTSITQSDVIAMTTNAAMQMHEWTMKQVKEKMMQIIICAQQGYTQCANDEITLKNCVQILEDEL